MKQIIEHYHTEESFQAGKITSLVVHAQEYLKGLWTVPVCKAISCDTGDTHYFTFTNELLKAFISKDADLIKAFKAAIKYGYRGYSLGKKNGIFVQRDEDTGLHQITNGFVKKYKKEIMDDLNVSEQELPALKKVKIVFHNPSGKRIVGVFNPKNNRIIYLGFGKY